MIDRKCIVLIALSVSMALPVQANAQTMAARTLSYLQQGFKLCIINPIMWGYHKALTPATLTAAIVAGAGAAYLANSIYGDSADKLRKALNKK